MSDELNIVYLELKERILDGSLKLPGLPDIANRVKRAIANPEFNSNDIARIIQTDIPLSGRIIQVANSPLYKSAQPVEHCQAAVSRLGIKVVRNLVTSFAVRRLYLERASIARRKIEILWKHSVKISAISFTLARISPGFDPERAMLAGLVHDIGELLIYHFTELNKSLLEDVHMLQEFTNAYKAKLGGVILKQWHFEDDLIQSALDSEDWFRDPGETADYADVVMVAHIQEKLVGDAIPSVVSHFNQLPVFTKFPIFALGEHAYKELMLESQDEIAELQRLLS